MDTRSRLLQLRLIRNSRLIFGLQRTYLALPAGLALSGIPSDVDRTRRLSSGGELAGALVKIAAGNYKTGQTKARRRNPERLPIVQSNERRPPERGQGPRLLGKSFTGDCDRIAAETGQARRRVRGRTVFS